MTMRWRALRRALVGLARVNRAYLRDRQARALMRRMIGEQDTGSREFAAREFAAAPTGARPRADLTDASLAIAAMTATPDAEPRLNLVLPSLPAYGAFAGIHTALLAARSIASKLDMPVRVLTLDPAQSDTPDEVARYLEQDFSLPGVTVVPRESIAGSGFTPSDIWLATHWKTAHSLQVACETGVVDRRRVAYLIQDYEPGFSAWSTQSVVAESTYTAGFVPIVNSIPLWRYLGENTDLSIDRQLVFAPEFDDELLRQTAAARRSAETVTVLYYARPSKARNLYGLGVSALRAASIALPDDTAVRFISVGEPHQDIELGGGRVLSSLGRLGWQEYFDTLARAHVVLSLQQTPHPSHPPFDAAISGAVAVTNDFAGGRRGLHPRIVATRADTTSLADALVAAITDAVGADPAGYLAVEAGLLGGTLDDAVDAAIAELSELR